VSVPEPCSAPSARQISRILGLGPAEPAPNPPERRLESPRRAATHRGHPDPPARRSPAWRPGPQAGVVTVLSYRRRTRGRWTGCGRRSFAGSTSSTPSACSSRSSAGAPNPAGPAPPPRVETAAPEPAWPQSPPNPAVQLPEPPWVMVWAAIGRVLRPSFTFGSTLHFCCAGVESCPLRA